MSSYGHAAELSEIDTEVRCLIIKTQVILKMALHSSPLYDQSFLWWPKSEAALNADV